MGAVTLLTWYFLLEQIPLQSGPSFPAQGHASGLSHRRCGSPLPADVVLPARETPPGRSGCPGTVASWRSLCLILGNSWYAALLLSGRCSGGRSSGVCSGSLAPSCFPLAALVRFRLTRDESVTTSSVVGDAGWVYGLQRQDVQEGLRFLLPLGAAVLASVVILVRALLQSQAGRDPLGACW